MHFVSKFTVEPPTTFIYSANIDWVLPQMSGTALVQFSSVPQSCLTLCNPMDCSMPGLPVHQNPRSLPKLMSIESVMTSNHLILCHPLLLLPSISPSIRVFSNKPDLCIRGPKYWRFTFSISPSSEYSGLISFRIDRFDLLAVMHYNLYSIIYILLIVLSSEFW